MGKFFNRKIPTPAVSREMGERGISLPMEQTSLYSGEDEFSYEFEEPKEPKPEKSIEDVIDLLIGLGDGLDLDSTRESVSMANFTDFLIKKFSYEKNRDYTSLFNNLILKISDSDILNSEKLIVSLTKSYSRYLAIAISSGENARDAKRRAYLNAMKRAETYVK